MKANYGKYKGYWKWDLAIDFYKMSNDGFFNKYGFNYVPTGQLRKDVQAHLFKPWNPTIGKGLGYGTRY